MPQVIVVMGVSGSGKSTIARRLASRLGFAFADADRYHPQANIDKMAAGVPLTDEDREPWLQRLRALIKDHATRGSSLVLACSALKERYRRTLSAAGPRARVHFVYLRGDYHTIAPRLRRRREHYMKASLLASQLRDLEEPEDAVTVDVEHSIECSLRQALAGLAERGVPGASEAIPARRANEEETP